MKYLIVGTGGVGGCIAAFLAQAGKDVTCIARGSHLEALRTKGITLSSDIKGTTVTSPIQAFTAEEYMDLCKQMPIEEHPDVIIVAVKGYSLESVTSLIQAAAAPHTTIIPILNGYGTGSRLEELLGETPATILDGCIHIVGFVRAPGCIRQMGRVFRITMGSHNASFDLSTLSPIATDLEEAGIRVRISEDIRLDTFMKWGFISAMAGTGAYHDCPMGPIQQPGPQRDTLYGLLQESMNVGKSLGIQLPEDYIAKNVDIIDHCTPDTTSSLQKDMASMHECEIDGQLFSMARLGHELGLAMPTYDLICEKFKEFAPKEHNPKGAGRKKGEQAPHESKYAYLIALWYRYNPEGTIDECIKEVQAISRNTIIKWWDHRQELYERYEKQKEILLPLFVKHGREAYRTLAKESGIPIIEIRAIVEAENIIHHYYL